MGGKLGVSNMKALMTTGKLAAIAVCQGIAKDGFQVSDFVAPFKSQAFIAGVEKAALNFRGAVQEAGELDLFDDWEIVQHGFACGKDVLTEARLAYAKIKAQSK